ncbi:hypothetical protein Pcinc_023926 [Petrolisthes cinctipes]|uniref:Uncharacterized protein n=1 Tax=Petrolisthes cinctipes TaxID=88211 RepID=A0AAE1FAY9_PETCI|nr:hypothetical protein Pcinc_023926 [Petrolisthes cinctipes]
MPRVRRYQGRFRAPNYTPPQALTVTGLLGSPTDTNPMPSLHQKLLKSPVISAFTIFILAPQFPHFNQYMVQLHLCMNAVYLLYCRITWITSKQDPTKLSPP